MSDFTKPRDIIPKYEEMVENTQYAITLSSADDMQFWGKGDRLSLYRDQLNLLLHHVRVSCKMDLQIEISSMGRLHCHGFIVIENKKVFYLSDIWLLRASNTIVIKHIGDVDAWKLYIGKQCKDFGSLRSPDHIPLSSSIFIMDCKKNKRRNRHR